MTKGTHEGIEIVLQSEFGIVAKCLLETTVPGATHDVMCIIFELCNTKICITSRTQEI